MCRMYRIYTRGRSAFRVLGVQTRGCKQPRGAARYVKAEPRRVMNPPKGRRGRGKRRDKTPPGSLFADRIADINEKFIKHTRFIDYVCTRINKRAGGRPLPHPWPRIFGSRNSAREIKGAGLLPPSVLARARSDCLIFIAAVHLIVNIVI